MVTAEGMYISYYIYLIFLTVRDGFPVSLDLGWNSFIKFLLSKSRLCYKWIRNFSAGKICKYHFQCGSSYV